MATSKSKKGSEPKFEEAMAQLEEIVRKLESGATPLEESLQSFETGVALVRNLHARLDSVQARIEELSRGADGGLVVEPLPGFDDDDSAGSEDEDG